MRAVAWAIAGLACAAGVVAFALGPGDHLSRAPDRLRTAPQSTSTAPDGRMILTKDQASQALASGTVDRPVKLLLAIRTPLRFGDYAWNDKDVPTGPIWVRVDLRSQLISVFRGA